jgi:uncharacterized repeat protein (TIGR03803 family)
MKLPGNSRVMLAASILAPFFALAAISLPANAGTETVIYSFQNNGEDGYFPYAALIDVEGTLYGTTSAGGTGRCGDGCGTIFSVDPETNDETVLHSFLGKNAAQAGSLLAVGGQLFGSTAGDGHRIEGSLFSFNLKLNTFERLYSFCRLYSCDDGAAPSPGLLHWKGQFYGTTLYGGTYGQTTYGGTVFAFDPKTGAEAPIYSFCSLQSCEDGLLPGAGLIRIKDKLYGTTERGGTECTEYSGCGTVFAVDPAKGTESVVYSFCSKENCSDGEYPQTALVEWKGKLYGTTTSGGNYSCNQSACGTVFSIDPSTGAERVVHAFDGSGEDGFYPLGTPIELNGLLYGTTLYGGTKNFGTVYSVDPVTGREKTVYSFCARDNCVDGAYPTTALLNVNGTLYGTTSTGGTGTCYNGYYGCGTVFAITP